MNNSTLLVENCRCGKPYQMISLLNKFKIVATKTNKELIEIGRIY